MNIAVILVHYHTPRLLEKSVEAVNRDMKHSGLSGEVIVVDNGSLPEDSALLRSLEVKLITPGANLGYAGGVNLGVENTEARIFIFMNPDVGIKEGCLGELVSEIRSGAAAAGPRFFLDEEKTIMMPPLMHLTRKNEIMWRLTALGRPVAAAVRNKWREEAKRHWHAEKPISSFLLTGALLAIDRSAWEKIGPFDETYKLYFEEADWLKRLEKSGLPARYVPAAHAVHMYSQSASQEPEAIKWFNRSMEIYRKKHYGRLFNMFLVTVVPFLRRVALKLTGAGPESLPVPVSGVPSIEILSTSNIRNTPIWIEISESDLRIPAAAAMIEDPGQKVWSISGETWKSLAPKIYNIQVVDNAGNEIHLTRFNRALPS